MILVPTKTTSKESSPLQIAPTKEKPTATSFADLLKGVGYKKDNKIGESQHVNNKQEDINTKTNANKEANKETKTSTKKDSLLSLLKNESSEESLEVNPKFSQMLGKDGMKALINEAKKFLQTQIKDSEGYKRAEIQVLPKTIKGLLKAAKEFGIDVSKITLQELKGDGKQLQILNNDAKNQTMQKDLQNMPLFKAQESLAGASTQQLVQIKQQKLDEKSEKHKSNDPLRLLLRGESVNKETTLSLEATKVLATTTTEEKPMPSRTLESLLRSETSENSTKNTDAIFKTDGAHKAESLDVKINEAKQMVKYLSSDVKNAIEDYKSPFTRVRLQLNPQNMGEMDLTVVQRGNNLHVNLSSNNAAINTLLLHANELRQQLQNSGINNATFNFSNHSDSGANHSQQEQRQQEQKAHKTYEALAKEDATEEVLSSLEIIVPRYI